MSIVVYTPTCRPGFDVAAASFARQQVDADLYWIVADDFEGDRNLPPEVEERIDERFRANELTDRQFSLDAANNQALARARFLDADLFVFFMDYTWMPPDGIARFKRMAERHPDAILTGIAHTADDPHASQVVDPDDGWTIFGVPYIDKPQTIGWEDVRLDRVWRHADHEQRVEAIRCELNWAALPRQVLHDHRLWFDEKYDDFHACDNIDFALRAGVLGYQVWIDYDNVAIRLPRRTYWPEEDRFIKAQKDGMNYFHSRRHPDDITIDGVFDLEGTGYFRAIIAESLSREDGPRLLKAWREHLQPGGQLDVRTDAWERGELQMMLLSAGFSAITVEERDGYVVAAAGTTR